MAHICNNTYTFQILLQLWKWLKSMTLKYLWILKFFNAWRTIFTLNTVKHGIHHTVCILRQPSYFGCHKWNGARYRRFRDDLTITYLTMCFLVFINTDVVPDPWEGPPSALTDTITATRLGTRRHSVRNPALSVASGPEQQQQSISLIT